MFFYLVLAARPVVAVAAANSTNGNWTQKEFIITYWCAPPAQDAALARVAREGFSLTWTPPEGLDVAARHGLRAMVTSPLLNPETLKFPARRAKLDKLIDRVKRHRALEAYYIVDEPGTGAFAGLGRLAAYLRQRDPAHFAYINLFPTYATEKQLGVSADAAERARAGQPDDFAGSKTNDRTVLAYREYLRSYLDTVKPDLLSYDHYHFLKPRSDGKPNDGTQYFLNLQLISEAARNADVPFLNIIQANTIISSWRLPNPEELRWLAFTTLAYGGRGISYFTYWGPKKYNGLYRDGRPSPLIPEVTKLNQEIAAFGQVLLQWRCLGAYHSAPVPYGAMGLSTNMPVHLEGPGEFVVSLWTNDEHARGFMIVNRDYARVADARVTVRLPGSRLEELDGRQRRWVAADPLPADRSLTIKLHAADGRFFRVVE